ncbi:MAG: hypothetical protein H8E55_17300, partial [Pelagibacterales bacterium]|nr:hypothetical protein [Pelagibacterales bacterium]
MKNIIYIIFVFNFVITQETIGFGSFENKSRPAISAALSGCDISSIDGANAIFTNPAGIISDNKYSFVFGNSTETGYGSSFLKDINYPFFSTVFNLKKRKLYGQELSNSFGLSLQGFYVSNINLYDTNENYLETTSYNEKLFSIAFASRISFFSIGLKWKYYRNNYNYSNINDLLRKIYSPIEIGLKYNILKDKLILGYVSTYPTIINESESTYESNKYEISYLKNKKNFNYSTSFGIEKIKKKKLKIKFSFKIDYYIFKFIGGFKYIIINFKRKL